MHQPAIALQRLDAEATSSTLSPSGRTSPTTTTHSQQSLGVDSATATPAAGTAIAEALSDYPDGGFEAWFQVACASAILTVAVGGESNLTPVSDHLAINSHGLSRVLAGVYSWQVDCRGPISVFSAN